MVPVHGNATLSLRLYGRTKVCDLARLPRRLMEDVSSPSSSMWNKGDVKESQETKNEDSEARKNN
jgi:hypothetical protein